jgi:hypothetical protein
MDCARSHLQYRGFSWDASAAIFAGAFSGISALSSSMRLFSIKIRGRLAPVNTDDHR